ncbi:MAG: hypothetical protein KGZ30_04235 [Anaplasmataceae bacterium]|nr:hypothetical protein [Anaplasmataceae bacterium]
MAKKEDSPFWKGVHRPEGYRPLEEFADPKNLTPEDILLLKEMKEDESLPEDERERIERLLGSVGELEDQQAA